MTKKILFSGYYGFDNSGDDAILQAIIQELRKEEPDLFINILSYNPSRTKNIYDVSATQRFHFSSVREAVKECDILISGGGSLLQDVTSSRSLFYYLSIIALAKLYRKKVYVYANGVGPINGKINQKLTSFILNRVDQITLRDWDSMEVVKKIGVKKPPIEVTSDPVYALDSVDQETILKILKREGIQPNKQYLGVCLRQWKKSPNLGEQMAKVLDRVYEELGVEILFIPLHYPEDVEFSELIQGKMRHRNYTHVIRRNYGTKEIKGIIGRCHVILAMRLHSLIYAVTENVPAVGLVYDPKVESHLKQLEIDAYESVENLDTDKLLKDILETYRDKALLRNRIRRKHEEFIALTRRNVEYVFKLLEK